MPVFESLNNEMQRVKSRAPANYQPQVLDTEKRLNLLFDLLNNNEGLSEDSVNALKDIAQAIQSRQFAEALELHQTLLTQQIDGSSWLVGVKRLILMSKATPV